MDPTDRERLAGHLAAMAAEGPAMAFPFLDDFGDVLRGVVRGHLHDLGRPDLAGDVDEVDGLVIDVALELAARAGAWDPAGGALPWTWAHRALRARIVAVIGHARADVDPDDLDGPTPAPDQVSSGEDGVRAGRRDPGSGDELERLAGRHPEVALLSAAITEAVGGSPVADRNRRVYVEYRLQRRLGDPSPAETVADRLALGRENIRQIHSRTHRRLARLVETDPRYRPLRATGWMVS